LAQSKPGSGPGEQESVLPLNIVFAVNKSGVSRSGFIHYCCPKSRYVHLVFTNKPTAIQDISPRLTCNASQDSVYTNPSLTTRIDRHIGGTQVLTEEIGGNQRNYGRIGLMWGAAIIIAAIAYGGLLNQPWSYDDLFQVEKASLVSRSPTALLDASSEEPLRFISHLYFLAVYLLVGPSPAGHHFGNIFLHLINTAIVVHVVSRFVSGRLSLMTGLLFLISTAGYGAISDVASSAALQGAGFALLAMDRAYQFLKVGHRRDLILTGLLFLCCVMSYESHIVVVLPLAWLLFANRDSRSRAIQLAMSVAIGILILVALEALFKTSDNKVPFNRLSLGPHLFTNFGFFFARAVVNPYLTLSEWGRPFPYDIARSSWTLYSWIGWALIVPLGFLAYRHREVRISVGWITLTILPYLFSSNNMYFTRYWYLSAPGGALLYAIGIDQIGKRWRPGAWLVVAVLVSLGISKAWTFEGRYLFHAGNSYLTHRDNPSEALKIYLRVNEDYGHDTGYLHSQIGIAFQRLERFSEAEKHFRLAIDREPDYDNPYHNLSNQMQVQGRYEQATPLAISASKLSLRNLKPLVALRSQLLELNRMDLVRTIDVELLRVKNSMSR